MMWVVLSDGSTEQREVDYVETSAFHGFDGVRGRKWPVLNPGETVEWQVGDERPIIKAGDQ